MNEELWAEIRRLHFVEKRGKSEIARMKVLDRATVRRAIASATPPRYHRPVYRESKLDPYRERIRELITRYPRLSAVRILQEIRRAGYQGGRSILGEYVSTIRPPRREAFLRIETAPGEQAQCDWANFGQIPCGDYQRPLSCFAMILSFSRLLYLEFTVSQRLEDFIRCHVNALRFFGGCVKEVLYDNLKQVVLQRHGHQIHFNPRFMEFAGVYLFRPRLCRPGRGSDKGKIENAIKYIRGSFWAGRDFKDLPDLNNQAAAWRDTVANQRLHGTTHEKPVERFERERRALEPLPEQPFDTSIIQPVKASKDCRVKFDSNIYSVPFRYAVKVLLVKATAEKVHIYHDRQLVATHPRSYLKHQLIENPAHYRGLVGKRPSARPAKLRDEFLSLGGHAERYLEGLIRQDANLTHHLARILALRHEYGKTEVLGALERALGFGAFGAPYIENIIIQRRTRAGEPLGGSGLLLPARPELLTQEVQEPDPAHYDELLEEGDSE